MHIPLYSQNDLTISKWYQMLYSDNTTTGEATRIYQIHAPYAFNLNGMTQEPGIYYLRTSKEKYTELARIFSIKEKQIDSKKNFDFEKFFWSRKFSFSQLVRYSDYYSSLIPQVIPEESKIKELAFKGEASKYLEDNIAMSTKGLANMREKVWHKYFEDGLRGIVYRFFSAIGNFFLKYRTGIYWPGNACTYADKVIKKLEQLKTSFLKVAIDASQEKLSQELGISLEEIKRMKLNQIRSVYLKKVLQVHPDKNQNNAACADKFHEINQLWEDFGKLIKLNEGLEIEA